MKEDTLSGELVRTAICPVRNGCSIQQKFYSLRRVISEVLPFIPLRLFDTKWLSSGNGLPRPVKFGSYVIDRFGQFIKV